MKTLLVRILFKEVNLANNNIQYLSGNYQMAGRSPVASKLPFVQKMNVGMIQLAILFDMNGTTGDNSFMTPAQTLSHLNFKKLPF